MIHKNSIKNSKAKGGGSTELLQRTCRGARVKKNESQKEESIDDILTAGTSSIL